MQQTKFVLLIQTSFVGHAGCLIVYNGVVYDPCGCNTLWCSPSPNFLNLLTLTSACVIKHVRDLVVDVATGLPTWPAVSDTPVPLPLTQSSFYDTVLVDNGNVANNPNGHWSTIEGNTSSLYCDVVVDWWPDSWRHPVGYHVTLPCTGAGLIARGVQSTRMRACTHAPSNLF